MTCHLPNEVVPILRVHWEPLENILLRAEGILARAMFSVGRVLIPTAGQRGIELHHGHADKVIRMIHTCFEIGDRQMPRYGGCHVSIYLNLANDVYSGEGIL